MNTPLRPGSPFPPPQVPDRRRNRRTTAFGVTAGLLGGGAIGLLVAMPSFGNAAAQEAQDTTPPPTTAVVVNADPATDETSADVADGPDAPSTEADRRARAQERIRTELQNVVDDGTITAAQADAVAADLSTTFPGRGPGGPGGPGGHHRGAGFDGEVLADLLGIDVDALRADLRQGTTVAEIAAEQGVDVQTVIDSLVAEAESHLDVSVENGRLTQEEADTKLADVTERITDFVNNGLPQRV
jgi:hypothetical protein